jgi:hypothetical protein
MRIVDVLIERGVISAGLRQDLKAVLRDGDLAAEGYIVPERVSRAAEQAGPSILQALAQQRRFVAQLFEEHVLTVLKCELAPTSVKENAQLGSARFDALVEDGAGNRVAVEIKSRLRPNSSIQFMGVARLVSTLPNDLALVLVVAGLGLSNRQLDKLRAHRVGKIHLVRWDEDHESFGRILRVALGA